MSSPQRQPGSLITFSSSAGGPDPIHRYRLAGVEVVSNLAAPMLHPFALAPRLMAGVRRAQQPAPSGSQTYAGQAYIAAENRALRCHCQGRGYRLEMGGLGVFKVDPQVCRVDHWGAASAVDSELLWQAFLGPCLLLLQADQQRYFLHASAVGGQRLTGFAGPSGVGKSTLAALAAQAPGRRLAADDLLPVRAIRGKIEVGEPFPQLKLADLCAGAVAEPQLDRIIALRPDPKQSQPRLQELPAAAAALMVSAHTIALKLFGPDHLRQHLRFCSLLVDAVECLELRFRQHPSQLPAMLRLIEPG